MHILARRALFAAVVLTSARAALGVVTRASPALHVSIVDDGSPRAADVRRGALMAVDEARHAASMFGGAVTFEVTTSATSTVDGVHLIVDGQADSAKRELAMDAAKATNAVYMNVVDHRPACRRNVFQLATPDGQFAWRETLTRFGAEQLNDRFRTRHGSGMNGAAWAGWFAVKSAWETTLRSKAGSARQLIEYLERSTTRFDGHKGVPLYFDQAHRLVQPTYDATGEERPADPVETTCAWKS